MTCLDEYCFLIFFLFLYIYMDFTVYLNFIIAFGFFTMEDCTKTTRFLKALNGGGNKGGLFCQLKDQELNKYVMTLAEDFQRNSPDAFEKPKIAPSHHDRQEDDLWVLNDNCQIDAAGNLLNPDDSPYEWLAGTTGENVFDKLKSKIQLPLKKKVYL